MDIDPLGPFKISCGYEDSMKLNMPLAVSKCMQPLLSSAFKSSELFTSLLYSTEEQTPQHSCTNNVSMVGNIPSGVDLSGFCEMYGGILHQLVMSFSLHAGNLNVQLPERSMIRFSFHVYFTVML